MIVARRRPAGCELPVALADHEIGVTLVPLPPSAITDADSGILVESGGIENPDQGARGKKTRFPAAFSSAHIPPKNTGIYLLLSFLLSFGDRESWAEH
jgi:hypothetical protein